MLCPPCPAEESERLRALQSLALLDGPSDPLLDRITRTARRLFDVPFALVTLVDRERQWFASHSGLALRETRRDISFCAHAIVDDGPLVVGDTADDPRFSDNPLVTGPPHLRFYAGQPLHSRNGYALGTLCLADVRPRPFSGTDCQALADLAALAEEHLHALEARSEAQAAASRLQRSEAVFARTLTQAAVGIAVATLEGQWVEINDQFCAIVGHLREQLAARKPRDIVHPDDVDEALALARRALGGGGSVTGHDLRFVAADGSIRWVQLGISALVGCDGRAEDVIIVASDINRRKQAEQELEALQGQLEQRIEVRTAELDRTVQRLRNEARVRERAQLALEAEKERFRSTLKHATDAFIEVDADGRVQMWNHAATRIFGWTHDEAIGCLLPELIVPPALRDAHRRAFGRFITGQGGDMIGRRVEVQALRRSGDTFPIEMTLGAVRHDGRMLVHAFMHDISRRQTDEAALRARQQELVTITDNAPALIARIGSDLRYQFHNRMYRDAFELPEDGLVGRHVREFCGEETFARLRPAFGRVLRGEHVNVEYQLHTRRGPRWFYGSLVPARGEEGVVEGFYLLSQDISERKQLHERLQHEAMHDPLTGLPNRRMLMDQLQRAMRRSRRRRRPLALLFMDLDDFKTMNDTLGHEFGDAVLRSFADSIRAAAGEEALVARFAGDEFVVVIEDTEDARQAAQQCAAAILAAIAPVREVRGVEVTLASSLGGAVHLGEDEETAQELLTRADAAMYRAKAAGKHRFSF